jgi:hypothetical protein
VSGAVQLAPKAFGASKGILWFRRAIPLLLEEIYFETTCVDSYIRKDAQKETGSVCF